VVDARGGDLVLLLPLGVVVGSEILAALARAEGAHQDEALDARVLGRGYEVAGALLHDAPDRVGLGERRQRDEVDDGFRAFRGSAEAVGVGHVPLDELAAPCPQALFLLRPPREHANGQVLGAERMDDVAAHEPGAPDDEDGHSKFRRAVLLSAACPSGLSRRASELARELPPSAADPAPLVCASEKFFQ
jgi:hypothetical protein